MSLSKSPYKGSRDIFPALKRTQDFMFDTMKKTASSFGFEPYDGPMLEEVALYLAKSGEELINEQIYSFTDRGGRQVAIRPEMTPTLARMVAQIHKQTAKPIKWFSIPNLWRYERPQRGRLREHWQFNCDIFGATEQTAAAEVIQVVVSLFKNFGADSRHFEVLINSRSVVNFLFNDLIKAEKEVAYKAYKVLDRAKKVDALVLEKMIQELNLPNNGSELLKQYLALQSFDDLQAFAQKHDATESLSIILNLRRLLTDMGLGEFLVFDPTIVRGLDYYTGIVFEVFDKHPENRRALCGGGYYSNLLEIFNEPSLPGIGFGLGDVTLADFLQTHGLMPNFDKNSIDIFIASETETSMPAAFVCAGKLRNRGLSVFNGYAATNRKKIFQAAEVQGASYVAVVNDESLQQKTIFLKKLNSKSEMISVSFEDLENLDLAQFQ